MSQLPACCMDLEIDPLLLLCPERLDEAGWEFVQAFGLANRTLVELQSRATLMDNGKVRLKLRCAQLQDDGRCGIYATRPAICRAFDCASRTDCACNGAGLIPVGDLFADA